MNESDDTEPIEPEGPRLPPPSERQMVARIAAHASWAKETNRSRRTAPARTARDLKFEREVDPEGILDPEERARRVASARKAYFTKLALRSAQTRRRRSASN